MAGTALSAWAFLANRRDIEERATARIGREVARVRAALIADLRQHEQALRAGAGFFAGSVDVTAQEFAAFVEKLGLEEHDPGVRSMALIVPVPKPELEAWLERQRSRGNDVGSVMTSGDRPVLHVIQYSEPARRGARALGWDAGADPAFRAAIERARETGQAALAGPLSVPHATHGAIFALEYPLYLSDRVPKTAEARQAEFRGTLSLLLNISSLMEEALTGSDPDIEVTLFDGPVADPARPLYAPTLSPGAAPTTARARRASDSLSIGGKALTLVFTALPGFERMQGAIRPPLIFGGGVAMSALLFGLLWASSSARERARSLAGQSTRSLKESERRYREVLARMADGLLVADRKSLAILDVNPALERMLGYSRAELLARTLFDVSGHERDSLVLNAARAVEQGSFDAGERLYVRKDGATVHVETRIVYVKDGTQDVFYGFLRNVAGRNPLEERPGP